jgi:hypothetical protein
MDIIRIDMSYSLSFYTVPAGKVASVLGSGDAAQYESIVAKRADDLTSNDEFFEDEEEDEDESPSGGLVGAIKGLFGKKEPAAPVASGAYPTSEELLHALIFGEPIDSRCGAKVGYVYEILVSELGQRAHADSLQGMRSSSNFTGVLDQVLKKGGVDTKQFGFETTLMARGGIIDLPEAEDFPCMGYLLAGEMTEVKTALGLPKINEVAAAHEWKSDIESALCEVRVIVMYCQDKNLDLFTFYY